MTKYYKRYIFIVSFLHSLISRAKAIKSVNSKHVKDPLHIGLMIQNFFSLPFE